MISTEARKFLRALAVLAEVFGEPMSQERGMAYFRALDDLALKDVLRAIRACAQERTFFPKPAEIRAYTAAPEQLTAGEAYEGLVRVLRHSAFGLPKDTPDFYRLLVGALGGPHQVFHMDGGLMRKLVEDRLPDVIRVATVRGVALPERRTDMPVPVPRVALPAPEEFPPRTLSPDVATAKVGELVDGIGGPPAHRELTPEEVAVRKEALRAQADELRKRGVG